MIHHSDQALTPQSWLIINGNAVIEQDMVTLAPSAALQAKPGTPAGPPSALLRSNLEFEQGTVEFKAYLPTPDSSCYVVLGCQPQTEVWAGLNLFGAPYGFAVIKDGAWEHLATSGHGSTLQGEHTYNLKILVQGSSLDLYINEVKAVSATHSFSRAQLGIYLRSTGHASVSSITVNAQQPVCFVVMQFTEEYNTLYSEVIKPTCEEFRYRVIRGDDFYASGLIINDITQSIRESTLVIADVTPNNPNVFYEVGFAHGIGKKTILLSDRTREKLPFDISGFRHLFYDNTIGGKRDVEERLRRHLEALGTKRHHSFDFLQPSALADSGV
jgi:hypothetical protein